MEIYQILQVQLKKGKKKKLLFNKINSNNVLKNGIL